MALLETLTDTFDTFDTAKWSHYTSTGGTDTVSGGVLTLGVDGTDNSRGGITTTDVYTVGNNSQVSVKIDYSAAAGHAANFQVGDGNAGNAYCYINGANLGFATFSVASGAGTAGTISYSPTAHAWLRMRFGVVGLAVTTYFDTSPDGVVWTQQAVSVPRTWSASTGPVLLFLNRTNPSPGTCVYDNLNIQADGVTPVPPAVATLLQDFNDTFTTPGPKWVNTSVTGGTAVVGGGVLTLNTNGVGTARVRTATPLTIDRLSQVSAKVDSTGFTTGNNPVLTVCCATDSGDSASIYINGSNLQCSSNSNGSGGIAGVAITYSPTAHAWWRMRFDRSGASTTTYFDTSPDGITWTQRAVSVPRVWNDQTCLIELRVDKANTAPSTIKFDNVNIAPDGVTPTRPKTVRDLTDDLSGNALDTTKWTNTSVTGGTNTVVGGALVQKTTTTPNSKAQITGADLYNLIGDAVYYRARPHTPANVKTALEAADTATGSGARATYSLGPTAAYFVVMTTGSAVALNTSTTYTATDFYLWAYLRLRMNSGGTSVYFDRSADGTTWVNAQTVAVSGWGRSVNVNVNTDVNGTATVGTAVVDAVNLPGGYFTQTLVDYFHQPALDTAVWTPTTTGAGTVAVTGDQLTITTAATDANSYGQISSKRTDYQLTGSWVMVSGVTASSDASIATVLEVAGGGNRLSFGRKGPNLAWGTVGSLTTNIRAYNDSTMQHWRILCSAANVVTLQYSADGTTWNLAVNAGTMTWAGSVTVRVYAQNQAALVTGTSSIDAVNGVQTGRLMSALTDDFLGTVLDPKWTGAGGFSVGGGLLTLTTPGGYGPAGKIQSTAVDYSLIGSQVYAKINPSMDAGAYTEFVTATPSGYASITVFDGNLRTLCYTVGNIVILNQSIPYDPVAHLYQRLRMDAQGGAVYFDTSPDTLTWTTVATAYNPGWGNGNVQVSFALTKGPVGAATTTVDAVNMGDQSAVPCTPDTITDTETLAAPTSTLTFPTNPAGIIDGELVGAPAAVPQPIPSPDTLVDPETLGAPAVGMTLPIDPDGITDTDTLADPTVGADYGIGPDGTLDNETLGAPDLTPVVIVEPDETNDPETLDNPAAQFAPLPPFPDEILDPETIATPQVAFYPGVINPVGITDPQSLGAPGSSFVSFYNGNYSTGLYGVGVYQGINFSPTGIGDFDTLGEPGIYSVPPTPTDTILPTSIIDAETLGGPALPKQGANNLRYGEGTYDEGPYYGNPATPTDQNPVDNVAYSYGTYGYGIYYGVAEDVPDADNRPLFTDIAGRVKPALHVIGIGPWSPLINWRGAPNYNIRAGTYPARPAMALPPATSKGFTLRLGEGGEARVDLAFPRGSAVILDEMDTDLWWRRKDPRTDQLEMIGRFNVAHLAVSTSDTGVNCSTQLVDYRTILGERLVLKYLHPELDTPTSEWNIGTPAIDIIEWALPTNTGLDLTEVKTADLGKITYPFHLPPGTSIADLMDNVEAVSPKPWEWWVETPLDIAHPPKLRFVMGERGKNKGVTLFDLGTGPTPIASWQQTGASDDYANAIYYTGGGSGVGDKAGGGVVEYLPSPVRQYGQRDVLDGNSSVRGGDIKVLRERATKKLLKYADRRPSYQIVLKQGFWRGLNHIDVGDTITLYLRLGKEVLRDEYRVSELTVDIDDLGTEDVGLTLGRLPASSDPRSKRSPIARVVRYLKNYSAPDGAADIPDRDDD